MKSTIWTLAAATALAGWGLVASAQQEQGAATQPAIAAEGVEAAALGHQRSANTIIGMEIRNAAGEDLGEVDDIILDNQQGRIAYAVVSYGGILGIGGKHFAVPWQAFSTEGDRLILDVDKERLRTAPGFEKGELPDQADPMFHEQVHEFYGTQPYDVDKAEADDELMAQTGQEQEGADVLWDEGDRVGEAGEQERPAAEMQDERLAEAEEEEGWDWKFWTSRGNDEDWARRLSEVIGTEVVNPQNEDIGDVEDVAIDMREGHVTFALVNYGGLEMKTAAVPWNALELNEQREVYVLDATTEDLEIAKIEADNLSRLDDEQLSRTIHEAFDVEPYWIAYGYEQQEQEFWAPQGQTRMDRRQTETGSEQTGLRESRGRQMQSQRAQAQTEQRQTARTEAERREQAQRVSAQPAEPSEVRQDTQQMGENPEFAQGLVTLSGTVEKVEEFTPVIDRAEAREQAQPLGEEELPEKGLHVQLQTDTDIEILHFPSAQAVRDNNIDLAQGEEMEIVGYRTRYLGEPVIRVTQLTIDGVTVDLGDKRQELQRRPQESI